MLDRGPEEEPVAPPPTFAELIEMVLRDANSEEALDQLAKASLVVSQISETGDAVLGHFVDRARKNGRSWVEISNVLGVTKQAVHKRFAAGGSAERRWLRRYTERARHAVEASSGIARGFQHSVVGTEHLLLALYGDPESVAAKVLAEVGADRNTVAAAVLRHVPRGTEPSPLRQANPDETGESADLPLTHRATDAFARALKEARELGHNYVGTEHLLLALYGDPESVAAKVLAEVGPGAATAKAGVVEALAQQTS
jgi:hypothetical protein